jgi:hypothetical protein
MTPDFLIAEKNTADGIVYVVLPTHLSAQNWLFARCEPSERRPLSAHLNHARFQQFKSDAAVADLSFRHSFSAGAESGKVQ